MSAITTQFLEWSCERLEAMCKKALLLVWDNASWHKSKFVKKIGSPPTTAESKTAAWECA